MSTANGELQTNDYRIINVGTGGAFATIEGSGSGVDVQGSSDSDPTSVKWHIVNDNGSYTITSKLYGQCTAYTTATPRAADPVKTGSGKNYKWIIRETNAPGQYLIYSANDDTLYWGLTSSSATVKMTSDSGPNAQWKFQYL